MKISLRGRAAAVVTAAALTLTACGGSDESKAPNPQGLEKPVLNIGVVPVPDSAPLQIAQQKGFFKEEGLTVKVKPIKASPEATPLLLNGSMDLALLNYVSTFTAQDKGAIKFKLVTDSYQGTANSFALLTGKDSKIKDLAGLKGKKIAVPALKSITDLLLAIQLKTVGLEAKDVTVVPIPLPSMETSLKQGNVDAIAAVEPFVTNIQKSLGANRLADLVAGPAKDFPVAGWGGTAQFAEKNPKTVAAFQRAIGKALKVAAADRSEVVKAIPNYTQIPADTASTITLGSYPVTLNATRLERVAGLMKDFGYLQNKPDVAAMLAPQPK